MRITIVNKSQLEVVVGGCSELQMFDNDINASLSDHNWMKVHCDY